MKLFSKKDILLVAVLLSAALILYLLLPSKEGGYASVLVNGQLYETLELEKDCEKHYEFSGYHYTVKVEKGGISVTEADCPDETCRKTGRISSSGTVIVCLPSGMVIKIDKTDDYDMLTY